MANQTPTSPPPDRGGWARSGESLRVTRTPSGAVNLNVDGRRVVGPLQGFGQLWQKTFRTSLADAGVPPVEVVATWKAEFPRFHAPENRFYPSLAGIAPGEVILINADTPGGPVSTGVMVLYADESSFTLMTPEGHPESGWVTFSAFEEEGATIAQVQTLARANDPLYELAFRLSGTALQDRIWREVLVSLARHYDCPGEIHIDRQCVDPRRQWSRAANLVHNAQIRTAAYTAAAPLRWLRRWQQW